MFPSGKNKLYNLHFLSNRKKLTSSRRHHLKVTLKIIPPKRSTNKHNIPTAKMYIKIANTRQYQANKPAGLSVPREVRQPLLKPLVFWLPAESDPADCSQLDWTGEEGNRGGQRGLHVRAVPHPWPERRPGCPDGERKKLINKKNGLTCGYSEAR